MLGFSVLPQDDFRPPKGQSANPGGDDFSKANYTSESSSSFFEG